MSRIDLKIYDQRLQDAGFSTRAPVREATVVVVEDEPLWSEAIGELCALLEVRLTRVSSHSDLGPVLRDHWPMAVLANMDAAGQDGPHVMKLIAAYDPDLPVMVLTGGDPALAGAADAVEEVWGLTSMVTRDDPPGPGELVEFLFRAGQRGRCLGLLPV
jgi:CheY-like chemotaxis protein